MLESSPEKPRDEAVNPEAESFVTPKYVKYRSHCDRELRFEHILCQSCCYYSSSYRYSSRFFSYQEAEAHSVPLWEPSLGRPQHFYEAIESFSSAALPLFECFSRLPLELRLHIWRIALPGPRVVHIYHSTLKLHEKTFDTTDSCISETSCPSLKSKYGWKSPSFINIIYVCWEAYRVVSSSYVKAFGTDDAFPQTWFNFNIDTLYIEFKEGGSQNPMTIPDLTNEIRSPDFANVYRLAIYNENHYLQTIWYYQALLDMVEFRVFPSTASYWLVHRRHEVQPLGDLTLIDIVDIDSLLSFCSQPFDPTGESARRYKESWGAYYWNLRRSSLVEGAVPTFKHKLMTTTAMAARIEKALQAYRQKRIAYKTSHPKTAADPKPVLGNGILFEVEGDIDILQRNTVISQLEGGL